MVTPRVRLPQPFARPLVVRQVRYRSRICALGRREPFRDEAGGVRAQFFGILRGLGRCKAHGARHADLAPVGAGTGSQPAEEGLAQVPVNGLGLAAHLGRLVAPALSFTVAERLLLAETAHLRQVGPETLLQAPELALAEAVE